VALGANGVPSFNVLQNYNGAATPLQFYVFDLLHLRGQNLRDQPLEARRTLLRTKVLPRLPGDIVLMSDSLEASVAEIVAAAKQQGLEGVIAKHRDSYYEPGKRSGAWVKMRINQGRSWSLAAMSPQAGTLIRTLCYGVEIVPIQAGIVFTFGAMDA
jgi:bifunctional non-homologous end joining protein LigD